MSDETGPHFPLSRLRRKVRQRMRKLMEARNAYLKDEIKTRLLLKRFAAWYQDNICALETVLDSFSPNIESDALVDVFRDMDAPWDAVESYILLAYLESEGYGFVTSEMIDHLANWIQQESTQVIQKVNFAYEGLPAPVNRNLIPVYARFASSPTPQSPLNVELSMDINQTVGDLIDRIKLCVDLPSDEIYLKVNEYGEEQLDDSQTLSSLMIDGCVDLFYDYKLAITDCPIINSDAYFTWRTIDRMIQL